MPSALLVVDWRERIMNALSRVSLPRFLKAARPVFMTALSLSVSLISTIVAKAQTYTGGGVNGSWSNAANWTALPVVGGASNVSLSFINNPATLSVVNDRTATGVAGTFTLNSLAFQSSAGAYALSGAALNFVTDGTTTPTLILNNPTAISIAQAITLGNNLTVSGSGSATLSGFLTGTGTSTTATTGQLLMAGTGSLTLTGGGNFNLLQITGIGSTTTLDGGTYTLNATNATSPKAPITVDSAGVAAQLNVQNGAKVNTVSNVFIGRLANNRGNATVSGSSTELVANGQLSVGTNPGAVGNLTIQNGALTQGINTFIGQAAGATGTVNVSGANSRLNTTGNLTVGSSGTGTLNLSNGGTATVNGTFVVGDVAGSSGTVTVDGAGSTLNITGLSAIGNNFSGSGSNASGILTIQNGGTVQSATAIGIAVKPNSTGVVTVTGAGSSLISGLTFEIGGQGGIAGGSGQLNILNGANVVSTSNMNIYGPGSVTINGGSATVGNINVGGATSGTISIINNGSLTFGGSNNNALFTGVITGSNATFTKIGTGLTRLSANSSFSGTTNVSEGILTVDGALSSAGAIVVNSEATLNGTGSVGNITLDTAANLLSQSGDSLDATSLLWNGGGILNYRLGGGSDSLRLTGALTKGTGSGFQFNFANNGATPPQFFDLITFGSQSGFSVSDFSYSGNGITGSFELTANRLRFTTVVIPEASTVGLLLMGTMLVPFALRRMAYRVSK